MTRDHQTPQRSSKSSATNQSTGQTQHNHHHHNHNHQKIVQFEPFRLQSGDDRLLKQAAELVETASLSRFKVCIVSIISKDPLDESMKNHLTQSILNNGSDKRKHRGKYHAKSNQSFRTEEATATTTTPSTTNKTDELSSPPVNDYENQVVGHVDSKAGVIVLNLTSFTEADKFHSLSEAAYGTLIDNGSEIGTQSFLSSVWPSWNQNLLKTLLILFTVSHIVVFYNPEPSMDYNLIQTFKILETMRLKSQARITDLLETIASKQMFPQNWIRQGRVACPRALFVCDASSLDVTLNQSDVAIVKRDLEDQIYKLLKKTNILARPIGSIQGHQNGLLSLPERDDFVFIIRKHNPRYLATNRSNEADSNPIVEQNQRELFYSNLFRSLGLDHDELDKNEKCRDEPNGKSQPVSEDDDHISQDDTELSIPQLEVGQVKVQPISKSNLTAQQNRFRKFLNRHISDIQASQVDQDSKNNHAACKPANLLLPRYDDFFTVLLRLKSLLFPAPHSCDQQQATETPTAITTNWMAPDERRFVDTYDLVNIDEMFSKRHCRKTRLAAFDYYCRDLRVQASVPTMTHAHHENILDSARRLYLNHARGSACASNLDLLIDQCNLYWQNLSHSVSKQPADENKDGRVVRGNRLCKAISSDVVPSPYSSSQSSLMQNSKSSLSIIRRANGIKVTTSCDCGRHSNFMITPVDRKKKLERVDIHRTND